MLLLGCGCFALGDFFKVFPCGFSGAEPVVEFCAIDIEFWSAITKGYCESSIVYGVVDNWPYRWRSQSAKPIRDAARQVDFVGIWHT